MSAKSQVILQQLALVEGERNRRAAQPALDAKVVAVKAYQQQRFSHTYADLSGTPRYGAVVKFFLDELYGPSDFTARDAQFARVVPGLVKLFPEEVIQTVQTLAELHALSEVLDSTMGARLESPRLDARRYIQAWQATGQPVERSRQITLTLEVARRLNHFTRKPWLRTSLRLMRGPAKAAGLSVLQNFLERGFDIFHSMGGADEFIEMVRIRETNLAAALFNAGRVPNDSPDPYEAALKLLPDTGLNGVLQP